MHHAPDPHQPHIRPPLAIRQVVKHVKPIYTAINSDAAEQALEAFDQKWGAQLPVITQAWRDSWGARHPVPGLRTRDRRVIYTTASRRSTGNSEGSQTKGHFPTEDAAHKLLYLAIQHVVPAMDPNPWPDEGAARVQDPIRRPPTRLTAYTVSWTLSLRAACLH